MKYFILCLIISSYILQSECAIHENVAAMTSMGSLKEKKEKSEACDELYTNSNLKNAVRYLKIEGKVVTTPMDTIEVDTHTDCCERCEMREKCVAWKFMKGKCALLSQQD